MKALLAALAMATALAATDASAQGVNLTGPYRCVQGCLNGLAGTPTSIAQYGWDLNFVNEVGRPVHAWIDQPGHIWIDRWNEGAVYSPDGMSIQFEGGAVWQRDVGQFETAIIVPPAPQPAVRVRRVPARVVPAPRAPVNAAAFDGNWSVLIVTQSGGCDRAYRYGVQINDGIVSSDAGPVNLQGRVAPNGSVRVSLSAAGNSAEGSGRLSSNAGGGTWQGQGPAGSCAGTWQAERRG